MPLDSVCNTGGGNAVSVAELTLLLILATLRRLQPLSASLKAGTWLGNSSMMNTHELYGKTLGIVGYGNTYISAERLAEAVHVIASGGVWLGQKVIQQLILEVHNKSQEIDEEASKARLSVLTRTEGRVADLVARGGTNLEIAADLGISERTVKAHLTSIYEKLHVGNRLSLALLVNQGARR